MMFLILSMSDIALVFGIIGYILRRNKYSSAAFIIAFVLARGAENAFRQSLLLSDSGIGIFLERPVAIAFMMIGLAVLVGRSVKDLRRRRHHAKTTSASS